MRKQNPSSKMATSTQRQSAEQGMVNKEWGKRFRETAGDTGDDYALTLCLLFFCFNTASRVIFLFKMLMNPYWATEHLRIDQNIKLAEVTVNGLR